MPLAKRRSRIATNGWTIPLDGQYRAKRLNGYIPRVADLLPGLRAPHDNQFITLDGSSLGIATPASFDLEQLHNCFDGCERIWMTHEHETTSREMYLFYPEQIRPDFGEYGFHRYQASVFRLATRPPFEIYCIDGLILQTCQLNFMYELCKCTGLDFVPVRQSE